MRQLTIVTVGVEMGHFVNSSRGVLRRAFRVQRVPFVLPVRLFVAVAHVATPCGMRTIKGGGSS